MKKVMTLVVALALGLSTVALAQDNLSTGQQSEPEPENARQYEKSAKCFR